MQLEPRSRQFSPEPDRLKPQPGVRNEKWETVNVTGDTPDEVRCHPRPLFRAWVTRPALGKAPDGCACNPFALVPWTTLACPQSPEKVRSQEVPGGHFCPYLPERGSTSAGIDVAGKHRRRNGRGREAPPLEWTWPGSAAAGIGSRRAVADKSAEADGPRGYS